MFSTCFFTYKYNANCFRHPLLPFLELLSRKCELATVSNTLPSYDSFEEEFHLLKNQIKMKKPYYIANDEVDKLVNIYTFIEVSTYISAT